MQSGYDRIRYQMKEVFTMTYQELQKKYPNREIKLIPDDYKEQYEKFGFVSIYTFEQPVFGKKFTYHFMIEKEEI